MKTLSQKTLTLVFALCLTVVSAFAQDIIVMRNSTEIKAKIRNIGQNEITYSKWSNQDGPTYTINKSDVRYIQYANGEKDVFENTRPTVSSGGNNASNGSYSSTGSYSGSGSYSSSGSYSAGGGSATGNFSASSSNTGNTGNSAFSSALGILSSGHTAKTSRPKGTGMKNAGEFLTIFGAIYSGAFLIVGAATGEDLCYDIAITGLPLVVVGIPLWAVGASQVRKSTQNLTYVPVAEHTWELGNIALVPSVGVTNDRMTSRQSLSAGLTLKF